MDKNLARVVAYLRAHHTMEKPASLEDVMCVYGARAENTYEVVDMAEALAASPYVLRYWIRSERRYVPSTYVPHDSAQRSRDEHAITAAKVDLDIRNSTVEAGRWVYICNSGCGRTVDMAAQQCAACREKDALLGRAVDALRRAPWGGRPEVLFDFTSRDLAGGLATILEEVRRRLPDPAAQAAIEALGALWSAAPWCVAPCSVGGKE
jgi:hypothetical protein